MKQSVPTQPGADSSILSPAFLDHFSQMHRRAPEGPSQFWHYCGRFDFLPLDSQCSEFEYCDCYQGADAQEHKTRLRDKRMSEPESFEVWQ